MYEVNFNQIIKDQEDLSCPNCIYVSDLERALAIASLLQKISTPVAKFEAISIEPAKFATMSFDKDKLNIFVEPEKIIDHEKK